VVNISIRSLLDEAELMPVHLHFSNYLKKLHKECTMQVAPGPVRAICSRQFAIRSARAVFTVLRSRCKSGMTGVHGFSGRSTRNGTMQLSPDVPMQIARLATPPKAGLTRVFPAI
jgi:hypothetical protein